MNQAHPWKVAFRFIAYGGMATLLTVLGCISWLDLPTATWIHARGLDSYLWMRHFLDFPVIVGPIAALWLFVFAVRRNFKPPAADERAWFVISATMLASLEAKDILKIIFGRTWPREMHPLTLHSGDPDAMFDTISRGYINDGVHGFYWLSGASKTFAAFPSGSTTALVATLVPIALLYPRTRTAIATFIAISVTAFVLTNTHFISDTIAGIYLGGICGLIAFAVITEGRSTELR